MNTHRHVFLLAFTVATLLFAFFVSLTAHTKFWRELPEGGLDFRLRMNEISCLRQGVDPYRVWTEEVSLPPYYPYLISDGKLLEEKGLSKPLNAYPPWEYTFLLPVNLLPDRYEGVFYKLLQLTAIFALLFISFRIGMREGIGGAFAAGFSALLPYFVFSDMFQGNFAILITLALAGMMLALERRRDGLAALCLAFAMVKPQMGALFVIPLLMRGKLRVVALAGAVCLLASVFPRLLCGSSVLTMILEAPKASLHAFGGCNFLPQLLLGPFGLDLQRVMFVPIVVGIVLCAGLSWRLKDDPSPVVRFAPAALCSLGWTYAQMQNYLLLWFVLLGVAIAARRVWPRRWPAVCLLAWVLCQWPVYSVSGLLGYFSGIFHGYQLPAFVSVGVGGCWALLANAILVYILWRVRRDDAGIGHLGVCA